MKKLHSGTTATTALTGGMTQPIRQRQVSAGPRHVGRFGSLWSYALILPCCLMLAHCGDVNHKPTSKKAKNGGDQTATTASNPTRSSESPEITTPGDHDGYLNQFCRSELREQCLTLTSHIADLRRKRDEARERNEEQLLPGINLEIGYEQELLDIYRRGIDESDAEVTKLRRDYEAISMVVSMQGLHPYSINERQAVTRVFNDFGELYIKAAPLDANGRPEAQVVKVDALPWSSYWYPKRDRSIFEGDAAPLAKLDRVLISLGREASVVAYEQSQYSNFFAEWEGLCDAWAVAAISTHEPKQGIDFHGEHFTISDLKALAIKLYEGGETTIYGTRYFGDYRTDGEIQDLRPEAFHKLALTFLGEKKTLLAIDDDPGPEVWVKPLYHFRWAVRQDPSTNNAFLVKAWPRMVDNRNHISDELTSPKDTKAPVYQYRLYVDPRQVNSAGEAKVIYGEWLKQSLIAHPDMVIMSNGNLTPTNKGIAANIDIVRELLTAAHVL